jgi:heterokaryon incompatibility protein (HET)
MDHLFGTYNSSQRIETYQYEPLGKDEFRILELLPGELEEPISIRLHKSNLKNAREYEAVSYTWGDLKIQISIICDGRALTCTRNLENALKHFRYAETSRFLWADALW